MAETESHFEVGRERWESPSKSRWKMERRMREGKRHENGVVNPTIPVQIENPRDFRDTEVAITRRKSKGGPQTLRTLEAAPRGPLQETSARPRSLG